MQNNRSEDFDQVRDRLIMAALPHVVFDGWTFKPLATAANELGLDATLPERLFGGGGIDAVAHFVAMADRLMIEDAARLDMSALGDRGRLLAVIKVRLDRWGEHREAIGVLAMPANMVLAATLAWGTADAVWTASGKRCHDFSWYTRRASLSAIIAATVLIWLDDQSEDCDETYAFLSRRMDEVVSMVKLRHRAWDWLVHRVPGLPAPG